MNDAYSIAFKIFLPELRFQFGIELKDQTEFNDKNIWQHTDITNTQIDDK